MSPDGTAMRAPHVGQSNSYPLSSADALRCVAQERHLNTSSYMALCFPHESRCWPRPCWRKYSDVGAGRAILFSEMLCAGGCSVGG